MELAAIVPLPAAVQAAAAFAPAAGEVALVRVVRALLGPVPTSGVVVVAAEPLVAGARACLDSAGLSAVSVIASGAPGTRRQCLATAIERLGRVIAGLRAGHRVVVPVLPMTDTVKAVDHRGAVVGTVGRTALRTVQYPRGYESSLLSELVACDADEFVAALTAGMSIATVDGDADAFAAELPTDARLLEAVSATHHPG
jgi:2-C-methyl-D-erythritol 4-phosphate cytidylyltransferase